MKLLLLNNEWDLVWAAFKLLKDPKGPNYNAPSMNPNDNGIITITCI